MSLNSRFWLNSYLNKSSVLPHLIQKGASYIVHIQDIKCGLNQAKFSNIAAPHTSSSHQGRALYSSWVGIPPGLIPLSNPWVSLAQQLGSWSLQWDWGPGLPLLLYPPCLLTAGWLIFQNTNLLKPLPCLKLFSGSLLHSEGTKSKELIVQSK